MKKSVLLVFVFFVYSFLFTVRFGYGQAGQWRWLHGSNTANSTGNFGTIGVPSPTNDPPAVYEPCEWTDTSGNFWLFGGSRTGNYFAALWKYDVSTNEWTWIKGPSTTGYAGSYGTIGVTSSANNPPAKIYGATTWTDTSGTLWLFGGDGSGIKNDLWKYEIATNEWTWMNGSSISGASAVYGTRGVSSPSNTPGARDECASGWTDNSNNLWLFGGDYSYCDMWKYNIALNEWTWMKGPNLMNQTGVYGTLKVEDSSNTPGARTSYSHWKDINGNLWLFGGASNLNSPFNDLWRYNMVTNNWTWMSGSNVSGASGVYGTRCVADSVNTPGERYENRAVWTDQSGNFWMFGGAVGASAQSIWNDLWMYCFRINQWIWISGDTTVNPVTGNWGTQGVWSASNKPNCRVGAVSWTGHNGHLYLFGGASTTFNHQNDLWEFAIDTSCGACFQSGLPSAHFTASDTMACSESGFCVNFSDHSIGNPTSWHWTFTGATPDSSSLQNPDSICYSTPGTYPVTLIVTNSSGSDTLTISPAVTLTNSLSSPTITVQGGDTLISSYGATYQWYLNGSPITGATDSFYVAHQGGTYSVQITSYGCNSISVGVLITITEDISGGEIEIYPNPASQSAIVSWQSSTIGKVKITVTDVLGENIYGTQSEIKNPKSEIMIDFSALPDGVYFLRINLEGRTVNKKFVVLHK